MGGLRFHVFVATVVVRQLADQLLKLQSCIFLPQKFVLGFMNLHFNSFYFDFALGFLESFLEELDLALGSWHWRLVVLFHLMAIQLELVEDLFVLGLPEPAIILRVLRLS